MPHSTNPWRQVFRDRGLWLRSLKIGLCVGAAQVAIHQADTIVQHGVSWNLAAKSVASPMIAFAVAFYSAASTRRAALTEPRP